MNKALRDNDILRLVWHVILLPVDVSGMYAWKSWHLCAFVTFALSSSPCHHALCLSLSLSLSRIPPTIQKGDPLFGHYAIS